MASKQLPEEGKIGIPSRLILNLTVNLDLQAMPPEVLRGLGVIDELKAWAASFKVEMESDPKFGQYCSVNLSLEEVI